MPPAPDDLDLRLRLVAATEQLGRVALELKTEVRADVQALSGRVERLAQDHAAHRQRVEPVIDAHGAYLARLAANETEAAAEAIAATRTAGERAAAAKVEEQAAASRTRTLILQLVAAIVAAALGAGGLGAYQHYTTPTPAQDAPGAAP